MKSIRNFLIVVLLSVICLVNFSGALHGYQRSVEQADQLLAKQLQDKGELLLALYQQLLLPTPCQGACAAAASAPASTSSIWLNELFGSEVLFQIWRAGQLEAHSNNAPLQHFAEQTAARPLKLERYYQGLQWQYQFVERGELQLIIAQDHDRYAGLIEQMIVDSILPIIWVLPLIALLIWLIVNHGLRPLYRLAGILRLRNDQDLSALDERAYPDEIGTVVTAINQLLGRLQAAFKRERRFAADAAHELRTPLAALKVNLHNLRQSGSDNPEQTIDDLETSVDRMSHSIEQILALHRFSPEQLNSHLQRFDLTELVRECIAECYPLVEKKRQTIGLQGGHCAISGDHFALSALVRNLIDNASKYTPEQGQIQLTVQRTERAVSLTVEDSGPGIERDQRQQVTGRFYRVGGDRHSSGVVGSGLGLSIVESVTQLHSGQLSLGCSDQLGGLCCRIELPV